MIYKTTDSLDNTVYKLKCNRILYYLSGSYEIVYISIENKMSSKHEKFMEEYLILDYNEDCETLEVDNILKAITTLKKDLQ